MIRTQVIRLANEEYFIHRLHSFCGQSHVAHSELLICPKCWSHWATLLFVDDTYAWPVAAFCEACGDRNDWIPVPGSLLVEEGWGVIDDSLLAALPEALLKRELRLHLEAYKT